MGSNNSHNHNTADYSIKKNDFNSMSNKEYIKSGRFLFSERKSLKNIGIKSMKGGNSYKNRKTYKYKKRKKN